MFDNAELATGAGSGVRRALEYDPKAVFSNGVSDSDVITHSSNEFVITIPRETDPVTELNANDVAKRIYNVEVSSKISSGVSSEVSGNTSSEDSGEGGSKRQIDVLSLTSTIRLTNKQKDIRNFCSVPRWLYDWSY